MLCAINGFAISFDRAALLDDRSFASPSTDDVPAVNPALLCCRVAQTSVFIACR